MTDHVLTEQDDGILTIRFNRPERKNALTPDMFQQVCEAMERAESDPEVRVIAFLGCGGNFTSGNDVTAFPAQPPEGEETLPFRFMNGLVHATMPVVAGVEGVAAGIGATMLLHCDSVIMTSSCRVVFPFINMALVPEAGSSLILPELLGYTRAADLLLSGEPLDGNKALEFGIATSIVESGELEQAVMKKAARFARLPRNAVQQTRKLLKGDTTRLMQRIKEEQTELFRCFASDEHKEAVSAFVEKRPPDFTKF